MRESTQRPCSRAGFCHPITSSHPYAKLHASVEHQAFARRTHGHHRVRKIKTRARYGHRRLKQISRTATLGGLFLSFLKIGLTGFGGGHDFVEALALGQSLPGTSAGNAVTYMGYRLRGWRGAGVSLSAFILPSMLMMIALAIFYDRFRALPNTEQLFHGFNSAVVALIAVTAWRMGKQTVSKPWQRILMIGPSPLAKSSSDSNRSRRIPDSRALLSE